MSKIYSYVAIPNKTWIFADSSRKNTANLVRTQSSNLWAYAIDIKEYGDKTGTVYIQFKSKNGGPGDIYAYYDVPIQVYKGLVTAPSKGHYFWKNLRFDYTYAKLTGDKRTKLSWGV